MKTIDSKLKNLISNSLSLFGFKNLSDYILSKYQIIKYIIVGSISNGANILLFALLIYVLPSWEYEIFSGVTIFHYQVIDTVNYIITIVGLNFTMHKYWTFESKGWKKDEFGRYLILLVTNHLIALGLLTFFVEVINLNENIGKILSLCIILCWNYMVLKKIIYKDGGIPAK